MILTLTERRFATLALAFPPIANLVPIYSIMVNASYHPILIQLLMPVFLLQLVMLLFSILKPKYWNAYYAISVILLAFLAMGGALNK